MSTVHVLPIADVIAHEKEGDECACLPTVEAVPAEGGGYGWLVVHNAWDGRA